MFLPILQSELSDVSPNEEFTTSLGVDQSVRITARPVGVVHGNTGVLTKNKLVTYTHTFVVKNTKTDTVSVQVSEQVPLSTDDRIKVPIILSMKPLEFLHINFSEAYRNIWNTGHG